MGERLTKHDVEKIEKEIEFPIIGIMTHEKISGGAFEMILHPKDC